MAAGFSVKDALNKNSKAGIDESPKARFRTKDISIFKMYRNDMNFYSVEQIEELAGDILMYGLKQNLELVYAPCEKGEYRIINNDSCYKDMYGQICTLIDMIENNTEGNPTIESVFSAFRAACLAQEAIEKNTIIKL